MYIKKVDYENLVAFLPVYIEDSGNGLKLIYKDREEELTRSLNSFLKRMAGYYFLDLESVRSYYGTILGLKNLIPIPFDRRVFIAVKTRRPRCKNDGAFGYIALDYIDRMEALDGATRLLLLNGSHIDCPLRLDTVKKHYRNGQIVKRLLDLEVVRREDCPATKGDIDNLLREMNLLRMRIK